MSIGWNAGTYVAIREKCSVGHTSNEHRNIFHKATEYTVRKGKDFGWMSGKRAFVRDGKIKATGNGGGGRGREDADGEGEGRGGRRQRREGPGIGQIQGIRDATEEKARRKASLGASSGARFWDVYTMVTFRP